METMGRIKDLILALLWLAGIFVITEVFAHYIYVNVIVYSPHVSVLQGTEVQANIQPIKPFKYN